MGKLLGILLILMAGQVWAHKPSDSYLSIIVEEQRINGQWDISLRDLDYMFVIDDNGNHQITWQELQNHHQQIANYAFEHLKISTGGQICSKQVEGQLVEKHTDGAYAVLGFKVTCPMEPRALSVNYDLFFEFDPSHRGLFRLQQKNNTQTAVFSPENHYREFPIEAASNWREFIEFAKEGVWHIWLGYDHDLFLLSLLLPAVVWREQRQWRPVLRFRTAFIEVLKIVTAFTLAHSVTLSLAALQIIELPSRWVESAIAASVLLAALNNLYPLVLKRIWIIAFAFGLIHGLGFASVLNDLSLPTGSLVVALLGFNLGVEAGQFAIVSAFLPLAFCLRCTWYYQRLTLGFGSLAIAGIAMIWLFDRSLGFGFGALIGQIFFG